MRLFQTVDLLNRGMDGASLRQRVLANNMANVNTPGFKRSDVSFTSQLSAHQEQGSGLGLFLTHRRHFSGSIHRPSDAAGFHVTTDDATTMRNDDNNVDPDREMVKIMENQLHYQAMSELASRRLGELRSVIGEGR